MPYILGVYITIMHSYEFVTINSDWYLKPVSREGSLSCLCDSGPRFVLIRRTAPFSPYKGYLRGTYDFSSILTQIDPRGENYLGPAEKALIFHVWLNTWLWRNLHTVVISYPRHVQKRVISLGRGAVSLNVKTSRPVENVSSDRRYIWE